jgi:hypothetical protein
MYVARVCMLSAKENKRICMYQRIIMDMNRIRYECTIDLGSGALVYTDGCVLCGANALYSVHSQCAMNYDSQGR